jgi:hypothetical protein
MLSANDVSVFDLVEVYFRSAGRTVGYGKIATSIRQGAVFVLMSVARHYYAADYLRSPNVLKPLVTGHTTPFAFHARGVNSCYLVSVQRHCQKFLIVGSKVLQRIGTG